MKRKFKPFLAAAAVGVVVSAVYAANLYAQSGNADLDRVRMEQQLAASKAYDVIDQAVQKQKADGASMAQIVANQLSAGADMGMLTRALFTAGNDIGKVAEILIKATNDPQQLQRIGQVVIGIGNASNGTVSNLQLGNSNASVVSQLAESSAVPLMQALITAAGPEKTAALLQGAVLTPVMAYATVAALTANLPAAQAATTIGNVLANTSYFAQDAAAKNGAPDSTASASEVIRAAMLAAPPSQVAGLVASTVTAVQTLTPEFSNRVEAQSGQSGPLGGVNQAALVESVVREAILASPSNQNAIVTNAVTSTLSYGANDSMLTSVTKGAAIGSYYANPYQPIPGAIIAVALDAAKIYIAANPGVDVAGPLSMGQAKAREDSGFRSGFETFLRKQDFISPSNMSDAMRNAKNNDTSLINPINAMLANGASMESIVGAAIGAGVPLESVQAAMPSQSAAIATLYTQADPTAGLPATASGGTTNTGTTQNQTGTSGTGNTGTTGTGTGFSGSAGSTISGGGGGAVSRS